MIYFTGHLVKARSEMAPPDPETTGGKRKYTKEAAALRAIQKKVQAQAARGEVMLMQRRIGDDLYEYHAVPINQKPKVPLAIEGITMMQLRARR